MTTEDILSVLQKDIHSVVLATVDETGRPQTCAIDLTHLDKRGLYFSTARGKSLYKRLIKSDYIALTGMKGQDTLSTIAISLFGKVKPVGQAMLRLIFEENPYLKMIFPTEQSRDVLEAFLIYEAEGEYYDLSRDPVYRQRFAYGGAEIHEEGFQIDSGKCSDCMSCVAACPVQCISSDVPHTIDRSRCLYCGNCYELCPADAIVKLG